ncbi:SDR family oxidoreductase [Sporosarcina sp. Marseille-Q4063]|uniref:SDR family NAD(P)-dependent oxidoreductase n=1 Tax=Sporosarcina sp. Marseille-Q4063 TaxID=2810514 RepID=UPI001BAF2000|nr:SDR family NAD(P)-dependent oxidoreductase [Sporosarcina sp. Marseille-Q4063]QUW21275.1 SDR family oxidoreductase [Sporosarcina sp. Marseille-Q4063]
MFSDKVVLITGGAGGIGGGIAKMFLEQGALVIINDISPSALNSYLSNLGELKKKAVSYEANVSSSAQVDSMIKYIYSKFGRIDVLVNAAGFGIIAPSISDISDDEWDLVLNVNLKGAFYTCRSVTPIMKKQKSGRIINISSLAGKTKSVIAGVHYTSAKAGLLGLTRHLADELMTSNITVNAICPGVTKTNLVCEQKTKEELATIATKIPMQKLGTVDDVVKAVKYFADFENSYITGISLDVNGGLFMN